MVMSWLTNSMTNAIGENLLLYNTTKESWDATKQTHSKFNNSSDLFVMESFLHDMQQGDMIGTHYFNILPRDWQRSDV